jgi:hypothetical protein
MHSKWSLILAKTETIVQRTWETASFRFAQSADEQNKFIPYQNKAIDNALKNAIGQWQGVTMDSVSLGPAIPTAIPTLLYPAIPSLLPPAGGPPCRVGHTCRVVGLPPSSTPFDTQHRTPMKNALISRSLREETKETHRSDNARPGPEESPNERT